MLCLTGRWREKEFGLVMEVLHSWIFGHSYCSLLLAVPSGAPFVSLEGSPESVRGGDNMNVTCTVLGEPEVDVSFTWSYPGQVRETELKARG